MSEGTERRPPQGLINGQDTGGPDPEEVNRITNKIIEELGEVDLESALTVVCNLAGQLVAALSEGRPSAVKAHSHSLKENIIKAALTKLFHDDEKRRAAQATDGEA